MQPSQRCLHLWPASVKTPKPQLSRFWGCGAGRQTPSSTDKASEELMAPHSVPFLERSEWVLLFNTGAGARWGL